LSNIAAVIGGKAKGKADQVTIDPALGCKNKCVGCYAKKSCQRGKHYDDVVYKNLDKKVLKKSIRLVKSKGFQLARVGKHCDPGERLDDLNGILDCCNDERFRCIVVSKSLVWTRTIANSLRSGNHILHISLGPYTDVAPNEWFRIKTAEAYRDSGVKTVIRLTRDVTEYPSELDTYIMSFWKDRYIITPMRYPSWDIANFYKAKKENFDFVSGYYRPIKVHPVWEQYMTNVCGEIDNKIRCCNCLEHVV